MPWEKQFDKKEALERACRAFWSCGYEGTSMTALLEQMGIQKGSFYATFGSKHQILLDALKSYTSDRLAAMACMANACSPRAALEHHLATVADHATGSSRELGCFVVNTALELAPRDKCVQAAVQETLLAHERYYRSALEAAKAKGEVQSDLDAQQTARGLLALVIGIQVLARSGAAPDVIESIRRQAIGLLE